MKNFRRKKNFSGATEGGTQFTKGLDFAWKIVVGGEEEG